MLNGIDRPNRCYKIVTFAVIATVAFSFDTPLYHADAVHAYDASKTRESTVRTDWSIYNGGVTGDHYSPLDQITVANVRRLKEAWRFHVGTSGGVQTNPMVVGRVLYGYGPTLQVIALDGATGRQLWQFDSGINGRQPSRGFTYWNDGKESKLFAYIMNFLYALDPTTGKPIKAFGEDGRLDMRKDLDSDYRQNTVALTTPGCSTKTY